MATSSSSSSSSSSGMISGGRFAIATVTLEVTGGGLASGGASAGVGQSGGTPVVVSVGLAERGGGPVTLIEVGPVATVPLPIPGQIMPAPAVASAGTVLGRLDQALDLAAASGGVSLSGEAVQGTPAAEVFTHAAGVGGGTVAGFDPALDSLLLLGEADVSVLLTEAEATVSLTDGESLLLDFGTGPSAWGLA